MIGISTHLLRPDDALTERNIVFTDCIFYASLFSRGYTFNL